MLRILFLSLLSTAVFAQGPVEIRATGNIVTENFTGVGFHAELFPTQATPEFFDQVIAKRWKELNPAFARVFHSWTRSQPGVRDQAGMEGMLRQLLFFKNATGTEVYLTTGSPKDTAPGQEREAYAKAVVDELEFLLKGGATNLTTYNMSNELSMGKWAAMVKDLDKFRDYHRLLHAEIKRRGLPVALLSTDASPISNWNTIDWAAANMDEITDVYGGHHYANDYAPDSPDFYEYFRGQCAAKVKLARSKGKEFILGEFGPAQYLQHKYGVRWDVNRWFDSPQEAVGGLQTAEAALAAMNAGVRAMGYWTFMDYPESDRNFVNHWGLFGWMKNGGRVRPSYYAYGLMTKFFHGPARIYEATSSDPRVRTGMARIQQPGKWSVAVINRVDKPVSLTVNLPSEAGTLILKKFVYDTNAVPATEDGDLQNASARIAVTNSRFTDRIPASSLIVYTNIPDEDPPAPVEDLRVERVAYAPGNQQEMSAQRLTWKASNATDVIYYRIFYDGARIGSTVSTSYTDGDVRRQAGHPYKVIAVDSSGNPSVARECSAVGH